MLIIRAHFLHHMLKINFQILSKKKSTNYRTFLRAGACILIDKALYKFEGPLHYTYSRVIN